MQRQVRVERRRASRPPGTAADHRKWHWCLDAQARGIHRSNDKEANDGLEYERANARAVQLQRGVWLLVRTDQAGSGVVRRRLIFDIRQGAADGVEPQRHEGRAGRRVAS